MPPEKTFPMPQKSHLPFGLSCEGVFMLAAFNPIFRMLDTDGSGWTGYSPASTPAD
jgi:hypothetical protein